MSGHFCQGGPYQVVRRTSQPTSNMSGLNEANHLRQLQQLTRQGPRVSQENEKKPVISPPGQDQNRVSHDASNGAWEGEPITRNFHQNYGNGQNNCESGPSGFMIPPGVTYIGVPRRHPIHTREGFPETTIEQMKKIQPSSMGLTESALALHGRNISQISSNAISEEGEAEIFPEDSLSVAYESRLAEAGGDIEGISSENWAENLANRFATDDGFYNFVTFWNLKATTNAHVDLLEMRNEGHWLCDIDTEEGTLMNPVSYAFVKRHDTDEDEATKMRRRTRTSNTACKEWALDHGIGCKEEARKTDDTTGSINIEGKTAIRDSDEEFVVGDDATAMGTKQITSQMDFSSMTLTRLRDRQSSHPTAAFYMRPAEEHDLKGVQDVYNLEVLKGVQATDTEPLPIEDFLSIFHTCRSAGLPFLVIVANDNRDENAPGRVLGFGFFSVYQPGLAGGLNGTGRFSVKVNIFVHPNERQQGVGSTLLDMLLQLSSSNYRPHPDHSMLLRNAAAQGLDNDGRRQYHCVFAEILYGSEKGIAEMWFDRVLTKGFGFMPSGKSIMSVHWSSVGQCWLNKLVYQRICHTDMPLADGEAGDDESQRMAQSRGSTAM